MPVADDILRAIDSYDGRDTLCGAMRISRNGQQLFEQAFGHASMQLGVANRPDTRFHIASATKMFIAAAVVRLATEGSLSLEAHPSTYLPALSPIDHRISIHHLLSHTSGLADIYEMPGLRTKVIELAEQNGSLLEYLTTLPQLFPPGSRWSYSSTGFLLLAYVLEAVAGSSFDSVLREMFFAPLGMQDTGPDDPYSVNPGRASGHAAKNGKWFNTRNDRLAEIAGPKELYSTVADLDRWGTALLNGEVLNEAGIKLAFSPYARIGAWANLDPTMTYGYGWFLGNRFRWIGGMTSGFRASMWQYPDERLNVIMLWNNERIDSHRLFEKLRPILLAPGSTPAD